MDRLKAPFRVANTLALFMIAYALLVNPSSAAPSTGPMAAPMGAGFEYEGRLGNLNGSYDFKFRLFNAATGGSQVYGITAVASAVPVTSGEYRTALRFGEGVTSVLTGEASYVDVAYRAATSNPNAPYTLQTGARAQLMPQAYAMSLRPGASIRSNLTTPIFTARNNGSGTGIYGQSNTGIAVYGESTAYEGVRGTGHNANHAGVFGYNTAGGFGVYGQSSTGAGVVGNSNNWYGVYGESTSYTGVAGKSTTATGTTGESRDSYGVYGSSTNGEGVRGVASGSSKAGVYGVNNGGGSGYGVYGQSNNVGVWGTGTNNVGVFGTSTNSNGVLGTVANPNTVGVYGTNSGGGYAFAAGGSASQTLASGGWVKAMALIDPYDSADPVKQCFNGQLVGTAATSSNCGITAELGNGCGSVRSINFGFNVVNRFVSVTPFVNNSGGSISVNLLSSSDPNIVRVDTYYPTSDFNGNDAETTCARFYIVVY